MSHVRARIPGARTRDNAETARTNQSALNLPIRYLAVHAQAAMTLLGASLSAADSEEAKTLQRLCLTEPARAQTANSQFLQTSSSTGRMEVTTVKTSEIRMYMVRILLEPYNFVQHICWNREVNEVLSWPPSSIEASVGIQSESGNSSGKLLARPYRSFRVGINVSLKEFRVGQECGAQFLWHLLPRRPFQRLALQLPPRNEKVMFSQKCGTSVSFSLRT
ncbi:unnamed protein product [Schistocephalus solidus]|uniref:Polyketide_cyc domain-containing protein n=1 Tax=Schistocephalus solidus TaxID=70667 RepID=A0A183T040_SCHSO|nr:unnamed protein product [Schistocephalus solidus]